MKNKKIFLCIFLFFTSFQVFCQLPERLKNQNLKIYLPFDGTLIDSGQNQLDIRGVYADTFGLNRFNQTNKCLNLKTNSRLYHFYNSQRIFSYDTSSELTISFWTKPKLLKFPEDLSRLTDSIFWILSSESLNIGLFKDTYAIKNNIIVCETRSYNRYMFQDISYNINLNKWNHWCFVKRYNSYSILVNGVKIAFDSLNKSQLMNKSPYWGNDTIALGSRNYVGGLSSFSMVGSIDDFAIWDKLLSKNEIMEIINFNPFYTNTIETIKSTINVVPNPVKNEIYLVDNENNLFFEIFNLSGRILLKGKAHKKIDVSNLAPGIYILKINSTTYKFVKD